MYVTIEMYVLYKRIIPWSHFMVEYQKNDTSSPWCVSVISCNQKEGVVYKTECWKILKFNYLHVYITQSNELIWLHAIAVTINNTQKKWAAKMYNWGLVLYKEVREHD